MVIDLDMNGILYDDGDGGPDLICTEIAYGKVRDLVAEAAKLPTEKIDHMRIKLLRQNFSIRSDDIRLLSMISGCCKMDII